MRRLVVSETGTLRLEERIDTRAPASIDRPQRPKKRAADYFALTKPRIIELLLVTTVPAMSLRPTGFPRPG